MAQAPESLRILYTPAFTGHLPALIANDEGFFTRNGLKVDLIGSAEPLRPPYREMWIWRSQRPPWPWWP